MRRLLFLLAVAACGRAAEPIEMVGARGPQLPPTPAAPWVKQLGGDGYATSNGVIAAPDGTVFVTGNFQGTATFGRGEAHETTLTSALAGGLLSGNCDIFIAAYTRDGALEWVRHPTGTLRPDQLSSRNSGIGLALTADGDLVVAGELDARLVFGRGEPHETELDSVQGRDGFLARYRRDGTLVWATRFGGSAQDTLALRVASASDGALYVAGPFEGDVSFDGVRLSGEGHAGEEPNAYLARYDAGDGHLEWVRAVQGKGSHGWGVAAGADGSAVLVGDFFDTATLDGVTLTSGDRFMPMAFVAKYAADGALVWAKNASVSGGTDRESIAFAAAVAADGTTFVGGYFNGAVTWGGGHGLAARGYATLMLASFDANGAVRWVRSDGGSGGNFANALAVRPDGELLLAGFAEVEPAVDFEALSLPLYGGPRGHDAFVARYGKDGAFKWASHAGGDGTTHANAVAASADGFVLAGLFGAGATFSEHTWLATRPGATDGFIAHYLVGDDGVTVP